MSLVNIKSKGELLEQENEMEVVEIIDDSYNIANESVFKLIAELLEEHGIENNNLSTRSSIEDIKAFLKEYTLDLLKKAIDALEPETESIKDIQTESIKEIQTESIREIQTGSIKEIQTESIKEIQPESIKEIQTESIKEIQTESIKEIQTESIKEIQPESIKEIQTESIKEIPTESLKEMQTKSINEEARLSAQEIVEEILENLKLFVKLNEKSPIESDLEIIPQIKPASSSALSIVKNILCQIANESITLLRKTSTEMSIGDIIENIINEVVNPVIKRDTIVSFKQSDIELLVDKEAKCMALSCKEYEGIEVFAEMFVEKILFESKAIVREVYEKNPTESNEISGIDTTQESNYIYLEHFKIFTNWPTIGNFTIEIGMDRINEYMQTWMYEENWLYAVDFIMGQSDECCDYYLYDAKWSIPTKEYPIPQATASVFFKIEVSRVKPKECAVNVTYIFEGNSLVHSPIGGFTFKEQWLFEIIESKLELFKTITF